MNGERGGRRVWDGEHMYTHGEHMYTQCMAKTTTIL